MIDSIKLLSSLTPQEKGYISALVQIKTLSQGEVLFHEGDEANVLYILQTGSIEVFQTRAGKDRILGNLHAEDILGEMALYQSANKTRMASARAVTEARLVVFIDFAIREMTQKHPEILDKITDIIVKRREHNEAIQQKISGQ